MNWHWRIVLTVLFIAGDVYRIVLIDKPREPITKGDVAFGIVTTAAFVIAMWWAPL